MPHHGFLDLAAYSAAVAGLFGYLPAVATLLSVCWLMIQIVRWWSGRKRPHNCKICGRPTHD